MKSLKPSLFVQALSASLLLAGALSHANVFAADEIRMTTITDGAAKTSKLDVDTPPNSPATKSSSASVESPKSSPTSPPSELIEVDATVTARPFPHIWEQMFGSGRAILSLRESYRNDLRKVKSMLDVKYVRFHGIFLDEVGLYDEDKDGKPIYNFSYIDQIYDGLLDNGVRPFVELSFMPKKLGQSHPIVHSFWYKPLVGPPKDWSKWGELNYQFVKHLVERYGIDEVSKWYFEVWNEPDLDFWGGKPKPASYYKLYEIAARAIKRADSRLQVGGPSTATQAWMEGFIEHCSQENIPLDFVSTHNYANEENEEAYKTKPAPRSDVTALNVEKIYKIVKASKQPNLPIFWSEYGPSYLNEVNVTDSPFVGPWLANNIRQCDGLTSGMSFWTFSDVFEENCIVQKPFYGGFGIIAAGGIPKASFNAFKILHLLGEERIPIKSTSAIATKTKNGGTVLAVWNYAAAETEWHPGKKKTIKLQIAGLTGAKQARIHLVDREHGSALTAWEKMGKPDFPSREQQAQLRQAAELPAAQIVQLVPEQGVQTLKLDLEPQALAVIEIMN